MDGKERVRLALAHQEPDRVPLYEGAFANRLASRILGRPVYIPSDGGSTYKRMLEARREGRAAVRRAIRASAEAGIELYAHLGLDMIRVRATDFLTPVDFGFGNFGSNFLFETSIEAVSENQWRLTGPGGFWSAHTFEPGSDAMFAVDHSVNHGGVEEFRRYVDCLSARSTRIGPSAEEGLEGVEVAVGRARQTGIFLVGFGDVAYPGASPYLPLFLETMLREPELVERYMAVTTEGTLALIEAQLDLGVDGILGGNDWCFKTGPMFSVKAFRRFLAPHLKRIVEACHRRGVPYIKHLDGNTLPLLPTLVDEVGVDGYHGIEPVAGMDIVALKKQYGQRITLLGNLDCGELLSHGSADQIREQVRAIVQQVSPGGGHIFSSSNSIHDQVPLENLYSMLDAVREYGVYPISV